MKKILFFFLLLICWCSYATQNNLGKNLYQSRCAVCHGADARATGPLAHKSNPPAPDLTTCAFRKRLATYPGVIVSSIILRPNRALLAATLRANNVKLPPKQWTDDELRAIHYYLLGLIAKQPNPCDAQK